VVICHSAQRAALFGVLRKQVSAMTSTAAIMAAQISSRSM
jgi:hypothetical protein